MARPTKWTEEKALELANELLEWLKTDDNVFFEKFLIVEKGLHRGIIRDLSSKYDTFSQTIKRAKEIQEMKLADRLLTSKGNVIGTIFTLKNVASWTDKQEVKTENINYNYDPKALQDKTEQDLTDMLLNLTKKPSKSQSD